MKYQVTLSAIANPDRNEDQDDMPSTGFAQVDTIKEASEVCQKYIYANDLGGGNWNGGQVYDGDDMLVAIISYNGRINIVEGYASLC